MKLIVGLGNPGKKYNNTRHNVGFWAINNFASINSLTWNESKPFSGAYINNNDYILLKPLTFMNNSGLAVKKVIEQFKINIYDILVIHDDLDIAIEQIKIQINKNAAGHNGINSIIKQISSKNFWRLRIGIKGIHQNNISTDKYVLNKFDAKEKKVIALIISKTEIIIRDFIKNKIEISAQEYNQNTKKEV